MSSQPKVYGFIPARLAASRFPNKPLYPILGRPMVEHVMCRARLFPKWNDLFLCTCDDAIADFAKSKNFPVVMTGSHHKRCLDRVAEAARKCGRPIRDEDFVVCVQGDEPMLQPDMIRAAIVPLLEDDQAQCTVLAMHIVDEAQFFNPDTVKIIHDTANYVLYTSRAPVPYAKQFSPELGARRIYGIFAFRNGFLQKFTELPESRLERLESCDSNRICDLGYKQKIAPYPFVPSFSVDSPEDIQRVEEAMKNDPLYGKY